MNECDIYNSALHEDSKKRLIQRRDQFSRMQSCTTTCLCFYKRSRLSIDDTDIEEVPG